MEQANGSTPRDSQLCELLGAYQQVLDTVRDLPLVPMILWRHRHRGLGRLQYLPRPRWLLRFFVVRHIDRAVASLSRRYSARAALRLAPDSEQRDREAVREFQQSLPPIRLKTYLTLLIVMTIILGRPIVDKVVTIILNISQNGAGRSLAGSPDLRRQVRDSVEKLGAALTPDFTSVNEALQALLNGGLKQVALVTLGLALSLYVVLRPFVPAFRLKRMLFNLAPEPQRRRRSTTARWSVAHTTGIYKRERMLFEELGWRAPREFPFDLIVLALIMLAPMVLGGLWIRLSQIDLIREYRAMDLGMGVWVLTFALLRLGWLYRTWRRRQSTEHVMHVPFEVRIHGSRAIAKVEGALFVGARAFLVLLFVLFILVANHDPQITLLDVILTAILLTSLAAMLVSLPWWYRVNRELRDLDQLYDAHKFSRRPVWSLLMMTIGWVVLLPPFISIFRLGRCVQIAQARAGHQVTLRSPWILVPELLFFPVLCAHLQHELNAIWAIEGEPIDSWPTDSSPQREVHRQHAMDPKPVGQATKLAQG
jgi:hypothetical protein